MSTPQSSSPINLHLPGEELGPIAEYIMTSGLDAFINFVLAAVILIIGWIIAGLVSRWIKGFAKTNEKIDDTLANFFASIAK
jgi:hypothetical protein